MFVGHAFWMVDHQAQTAAPERGVEQLARVARHQALEAPKKVGVDGGSHGVARSRDQSDYWRSIGRPEIGVGLGRVHMVTGGGLADVSLERRGSLNKRERAEAPTLSSRLPAFGGFSPRWPNDLRLRGVPPSSMRSVGEAPAVGRRLYNRWLGRATVLALAGGLHTSGAASRPRWGGTAATVVCFPSSTRYS